MVSSTLYGHRFLTGEVGGSVTHQCFYSITPVNKHDRKYWCKVERSGICSTIISTTGYTSKDHAGRVSLKDIPQNGTFTVTLSKLKSSDTGTYRCGIGDTNRDLYVRLNLVVLAGRMLAGEGGAWLAGRVWGQMLEHPHYLFLPCAVNQVFTTEEYENPQIWPNQLLLNVTGNSLLPAWGLGAGGCLPRSLPTDAVTLRPIELVWGELHSSVTVLCPPGDTEGSKKRFWCKLERTGCTLIANTDGYVGKGYQGRISITPQESSGAFKILINDLKKEDSGLYRCGTGRLSAQDGSQVVVLRVTAGRMGRWGLHGLRRFLAASAEECGMLTQPSPTCSLHPSQETQISQRHRRRLAVREVPLRSQRELREAVLVQVEGRELRAARGCRWVCARVLQRANTNSQQQPGERDLHGGDGPPARGGRGMVLVRG